jgi:hypothetical protein
MKVRLLMFVAVVSLLWIVTPAVSQLLETTWTADIPFEFTVADSQMPAGQYLIKSNPHTMRLTVTNKETRQNAFLFTRNTQKLTPNEKTVLIFQRDGDRHVLHQIWGEAETHGHDVVHGLDVVELTKAK